MHTGEGVCVCVGRMRVIWFVVLWSRCHCSIVTAVALAACQEFRKQRQRLRVLTERERDRLHGNLQIERLPGKQAGKQAARQVGWLVDR